MLIAGAVVVVLVLGVALATVGNLLRYRTCLASGAECRGVTPISRPIGTAVYLVGTVVAVTAPVTVGLGAFLVWRRNGWRR